MYSMLEFKHSDWLPVTIFYQKESLNSSVEAVENEYIFIELDRGAG